ncbi:MAG: lipoate--protein ligase [Eubacteriales bacterium]
MIRKSYYFINNSGNPHETLALEEYMLEHISPGEIILYLYTHKNSVIIGKNQNAWAECRHELLSKEKGTLARRISGGGAVFHDVGNLNFSFIVDKCEYNLTRQLSVILSAVRTFGIEAEFSGRNDIVVDGKKFSGNAFCHRRGGSFHHGTILINVDKENLAKYLQVSKDKIESKGIASVRSRVCNLTEYNPDITSQSMTEALLSAFANEYGEPEQYNYSDEANLEVEKLAGRNAEWEWLFGNTPKFDITLNTRFEWGGVELCFALKDAAVQDVTFYSDAMDADFIGSVSCALIGLKFKSDVLAQAIAAVPCADEQQKTILMDIAAFILEKSF